MVSGLVVILLPSHISRCAVAVGGCVVVVVVVVIVVVVVVVIVVVVVVTVKRGIE